MHRSIREAVDGHFPSRYSPQDIMGELAGLRPTAANLAPSESWRRMLGGRKRYNSTRQQVARARREAILVWLTRHRQHLWSDVLQEYLFVGRIIVRHGDGALLARGLRVGKATICRDLSTLQAVFPSLFGSLRCSVEYVEYMAGWRHGRRVGMGTEQPDHNLRFPQNRRRRSGDVRQSRGADYAPHADTEVIDERRPAKRRESCQTVAEFLVLLADIDQQTCPPKTRRKTDRLTTQSS